MFLVFLLRRKLLILFGSLLLLFGIWAWTIHYGTYRNASNGIFLTFDSDKYTNKILTIQEFDNVRDKIVAKYGIGKDDENVHFVQPTEKYSHYADSSIHLKERFQQWSSLFSNKDAVKVLQNLEQPARVDIAKKKKAERTHLSSERLAKYEQELHRMVIFSESMKNYLNFVAV